MPEIAVALNRIRDYADPFLEEMVGQTLAAAWQPARGTRILVKPNLLMAHELACTSPKIVAAVCKWLLEQGAMINVCDSPAFGTAPHVAKAIGLADALKPLGLKASGFSGYRPLHVRLHDGKMASVKVGIEALECDHILSVARIKAHSQMRMTLATKNCYGCIGGCRKALAHSRFGKNAAYFADFVAALWAALPPAAGFLDGIVAMNITGPRNGKPFELGLIGASSSTVALDEAILAVLGISPAEIPLAQALKLRGVEATPIYNLLKPGDFSVSGFEAPQKLKNISFSPLVLAKSICKRLLTGIKP